MVLQVTTANNIKVYTVSGGLGSRAIPDWLARQKKKQLKEILIIEQELNLYKILNSQKH
ncbi:unnamed protein product [Rhizopus microsporus]